MDTRAKNPVDIGFWMGDYSKVPLWGTRLAQPDVPLVDISIGSVWTDYCVDYIGNLIKEDKFDGVFLDVLGWRPWMSLAAFQTWPAAEQARWTNGAVDLARRIHEKRLELNPDFKIVHNNNWQKAPQGEAYCNGVCVEHHPALVNGRPSWHANNLANPFSGLPKRNLVIAMDAADAQAWIKVPGATHVCAQDTYLKVEAPLVPYEDLRLPELRAQVDGLKAAIQTLKVDLETASDVIKGTQEELNKAQALAEKYNSQLESIREILES
jgi:hypothetical protein